MDYKSDNQWDYQKKKITVKAIHYQYMQTSLNTYCICINVNEKKII